MIVVFLLVFVAIARADDPPKVTKPIPVVQPGDDLPTKTPKDDSPRVIKPVIRDDVEETSGILPLSFVKNRVETMPVGTKAYISADTVKCDSKRKAWVDPDQVYGTQNEGRIIMITRDASGYHLIFDKIDNQWVCQELPTGVKWLPVKTITSK
jgi:hypothetical protein